MTEIVDERQRLSDALRAWARGGTSMSVGDIRKVANLLERDGNLLQRLRFARPAGTTDPIWDELHNALASPSEGNKKGQKSNAPSPSNRDVSAGGKPWQDGVPQDHRPGANADAAFGAELAGHEGHSPQGPGHPDEAGADPISLTGPDTLASRPQEQPRKATGEVEAAIAAFEAAVVREGCSVNPEDFSRLAAAKHKARDAIAALSVSPAAAQGWQERAWMVRGAELVRLFEDEEEARTFAAPFHGAVIPLYSYAVAPPSPAEKATALAEDIEAELDRYLAEQMSGLTYKGELDAPHDADLTITVGHYLKLGELFRRAREAHALTTEALQRGEK